MPLLLHKFYAHCHSSICAATKLQSPGSQHELILFPTKSTFSPQFIFGRILKNGLSKLHYRFRSCIIDFDDIQLCLRQFYLNLNICKVKTVFLIFLGQNLNKIVVTLQILVFKQNCFRQS